VNGVGEQARAESPSGVGGSGAASPHGGGGDDDEIGEFDLYPLVGGLRKVRLDLDE
jgi:hypothetical protein